MIGSNIIFSYSIHGLGLNLAVTYIAERGRILFTPLLSA